MLSAFYFIFILDGESIFPTSTFTPTADCMKSNSWTEARRVFSQDEQDNLS